MNRSVDTSESNEDLLTAAGGGDHDAFRRLYDQTNRRIYAYLFRLLNNETMVKDVFVDAYSEIWKSAKNYQGHSSALSWMTGLARNLAMNLLKKQRHHDDIDQQEYHLFSNENNDLEQAEKGDIINKALSALKPQHREIISLVLLKEYSYQTVADILDIPLNTAKTRVFYAKDLLKKKLAEVGFTENDI